MKPLELPALLLSIMNDLRGLFRYFRPYRVSLAVGIACILAGVIANVTIPLIVGGAFDANWKVSDTCEDL